MTFIIRQTLLILFLALLSWVSVSAQARYDTLVHNGDSTKTTKMMAYPQRDGTLLLYRKPKPFSFITKLPRTFGDIAKESFTKKSLKTWGIITGSTLLLVAFDQNISDGVQQFSQDIHVSSDTPYKTLIGFKLGSKEVPVYQLPQNLNTAFYSVGEGFTSIAISGGFFVYGKIKRDYRALQTASQILQVQLAVGLLTQAIKRMTGRESPFVATASGGVWKPFPGFSEYTKNTPHYDAFPSGHMATMMATVTVLADNYPSKKWIRPFGYSLMGLVGLAMINNGVHWASDYPLALGIGYVTGKVAVKMNRIVMYDGNRKMAEVKKFERKKKLYSLL